MKYTQCGDEVEITGVVDFDLAKTFECGQCFRWNADCNGVYTGVAYGRVARIRQVGRYSGGARSIYISGSKEDFEGVWREYFDLDRDYAEVRRRLSVDDFMRRASDSGAGIRILRQDAWEALCSFIISQCNNIPRIKKIIASLCENFGDRIEFQDGFYYTFPCAERLAACSEENLAPIRCGYRAAYIIDAARSVAGGSLDLDALSRGSQNFARAALKRIRGVGDKVADCTLLYGLKMLDSFPLDVWMKRAVSEFYGEGFDPGIFRPYAGIAQQYMFHYIRNTR